MVCPPNIRDISQHLLNFGIFNVFGEVKPKRQREAQNNMEEKTEAPMGTEGSKTRYGLDPESIERDSEIQFLRGSGPGGQNRNKVETGVRLTHRPTGISVTATDTKSQSQNRDNALERLRRRLIDMNTLEAPRIATRTPKRVKKQRVEQKRILGKKKESRQHISGD